MNTRPRSRARPRHAGTDDAEQDQHRRDFGDVERQRLDDQRRADIGAQHDRERGDQIDHAGRRQSR